MNSDHTNDKHNEHKESTSNDSESDEDYVPSLKELKTQEMLSEEDNSDEVEGESERDSRKRFRKASLRQKRVKMDEERSEEPENKTKIVPQSSENIEDIWAQFKKDCGQPVKQEKSNLTKAAKPELSSNSENKINGTLQFNKDHENRTKTKTVTELFEFAGEAVEVTKVIPIEIPEPSTTSKASTPGSRRGGGLFSMLGQLGKKNKLSVLEKTKLDWDAFKKDKGIAEELQTHNKGKNGYLEKQDFLQRSDLRQFEIEKAMRSSRRLK